jgi:hypothetical protein
VIQIALLVGCSLDSMSRYQRRKQVHPKPCPLAGCCFRNGHEVSFGGACQSADELKHWESLVDDNYLAIWLAIFILSALLIGGATAWLTWLRGTGLPGSLLAGGAAFGGALILFMTVYGFMHGHS